MSTSIVFIDTRVADYQTLIDGLEPGAEFYLIDSGSDGLEQVAARLLGRTGIDAIHIISHGSSGSVLLGSSAIDSAALATHASQLEAIGQSLTEAGDILLYGCNVAAADAGVQFIGSLAQATGADVAASTDLTGSNDRSGNWLLEFSKGNIDIAPIQAANQGGKKHTERSLFEKGGLAQAARWRMMSARCGPWPAKIIRSWRQNPKDTPSLRQVCFRLATVSRHGRPGSLPIGSSLPRCQTR
jgi:hypothetical protein